LKELDADPWSFTLPNGRIDLRAAAAADLTSDMTRAERAEARVQWLKPHDREGYPTKCAGVGFDPGAGCPGWRAFLELTLPEVEVRDCFQRAMGAILFGRNEPQCAFLFGERKRGQGDARGGRHSRRAGANRVRAGPDR
jgi:putative DNA primase/helicase